MHIETRHGPDKIYISETRSNLGDDDCVLNLGSGDGGQDDDHNKKMLSSDEMVIFGKISTFVSICLLSENYLLKATVSCGLK